MDTRDRVLALLALGAAPLAAEAQKAAKNWLPAVYGLREFVDAGGLTIPQSVLAHADEVIQ